MTDENQGKNKGASANGRANGANGHVRPEAPVGDGAARAKGRAADDAPETVRELAESCVRFVERAVGVKLDYELETLPLLDHYLHDARASAREKLETRELVSRAAGAYFGEVVRRRHAAWWDLDEDAEGWQLQFEHVPLVVRPVAFALEALLYEEPKVAEPKGDGDDDEEEEPEDEEPADAAGDIARANKDPGRDAHELPNEETSERLAGLVLAEGDREFVMGRLNELPEVSLRDYHSLATRVEVVDIAVEAIRARRLAAGLAESVLTPDDYEGGLPPGAPGESRQIATTGSAGEDDDD